MLNKIDPRHGDFREVVKTIASSSIDAVITDPMYGRNYLPLWSDLARSTKRETPSLQNAALPLR